MIDSKNRSLIKAISWRFLGVTILFLVASALLKLKSDNTPAYIAVFYHSIMVLLYIFHERLWNLVRWGKTKGLFIQMTGLSGAGKSALAYAVCKKLRNHGYKVEIIDGDEYRENISKDLTFSKEDRNTNIHRLSFVGKVLARNNVISIMSAINPYDSVREEVKKKYKNSKLVYIKCDIDTLIKRDPKGLYKKALLPDGHPDKINNFTGISDPFEEPTAPDLIIDTNKESLKQSAKRLYNFITKSVEK